MPEAPSGYPGVTGNLTMYPGLSDYMGLELSEDVIRANMPEYLPGADNRGALVPTQQVNNILWSRLYSRLVLVWP
jgi:hypothetical protein